MFKFIFLVGFLLCFHGDGTNSKIIKPASSLELQSILDLAQPGDTIQMLPMTYTGDFIISSDASAATLIGTINTTIKSKIIGIHLKGNGWELKNFVMKGSGQGVLIEGRMNTLEGIVLNNTGKALEIKGEENIIKNCAIMNGDPGIILEGSKNSLFFNVVTSIIISEASCCGILDGNVVNGNVALDGTKYTFHWNVVNQGLHVKGSENQIIRNMANGNEASCGSKYKSIGYVANHGLYVKGCDNQFVENKVNGATTFPNGESCKAIDNGGNIYN